MDNIKNDSLHIAVCVKPIFDPSIVSLNAESHIDKEDLFPILNPRDLRAVEEAMRIKENHLVESVTIVSIAPPSMDGLLRRCLAMGADKAVRLWDDSMNNIYNDAIGIVLAHLIGYFSFNLILCGHKASDDDMGITGYVIAEQLGIPFVNKAVNITLSKQGKVTVKSKLEGGNREIVETSLPVVVGIEMDIYEPRYASLPSLISSLRKPIEQLDLKTIGLSEKEIATKIQFEGFSQPHLRPKKLFTPDSNLSAAERLRLVMSGGIAEKKEDLFEGSPEELSHKFIQFLDQIDIGVSLNMENT